MKIYRTTILLVVLHGCEIWSLILKEEHRTRVSENRVLRNILRPRKDEVTGNGEDYITRSFTIRTAHRNYSGIKSRRMKGAGHVARTEDRKGAYSVLGEET